MQPTFFGETSYVPPTQHVFAGDSVVPDFNNSEFQQNKAGFSQHGDDY